MNLGHFFASFFCYNTGNCNIIKARKANLAQLVSHFIRTIMSITSNKKAFHDYFIEERIEAGIVLEGWEVKAIREGRANLKDTYVIIRNGELFLLGGNISPLLSASTHVKPDAMRTRKLLLKAEEISKLIGKVEQKGFTLIPLDFHYTRGRIKCEIALGKGKQDHDKRDSLKDKEWLREKQRVISDFNKRS
jgi:SsrA-binding protein